MAMVAAMGYHNPIPVVAGTPPDGPPTSALETLYGGSLIALGWTSGDALADTQIGYKAGGAEPDSVLTYVEPGETVYETGGTTSSGWWVRHLRNSLTTAWVAVEVDE